MSKLEERQTESYHVEILYAWYRKSETEGGTAIWDGFCSQRDPIWRNSPHKPLAIFVTVWLVRFLSVFFFSFSQTPWKRKPSERMMGTEEHRGFKHTHGHSPICLAHNLLCWQTKQSKETLAVFIEAWLKALYILKPDGAEQRRCWRYYFAHCFHTVLKLLPLYPLTICSEHCLWSELTNERVQ